MPTKKVGFRAVRVAEVQHERPFVQMIRHSTLVISVEIRRKNCTTGVHSPQLTVGTPSCSA